MAIVSKWRMRGNTNDSVGTNHGTGVGITYSYGPTNASALFAGNVNSYVTVPDANSLSSPTQIFSLSCLVQYVNPVWAHFLYTKGQNGGYEWAMSSQYKKVNALKYTLGGASGYSVLGNDAILVADKWHHIINTWNNTYPVIYIDGVPRASTTYNTAPPVPTNGQAPVVMGKRADNAAPFYGKLADVTYNSHHITAGMAKNEYMQLKGVFC